MYGRRRGVDFAMQVPRPRRKWHATARDAVMGGAVWWHVSTYHRGLDESVEELAIGLQVFGRAVVRRSVMEWKISGAGRPIDAVLLKLD